MPTSRARGAGSQGDANSGTSGGSRQGQRLRQPTAANNNSSTSSTSNIANSSRDIQSPRLRSATRATAAAASSPHSTRARSGVRRDNTSPSNNLTTPTRPSRQRSGINNSGSSHGSQEWANLVGSAGASSSGSGNGNNNGGGAPGSASSLNSPPNTTSRQLRGPLPNTHAINPHAILKRSSGSTGSFSGAGNNSFSAAIASLAEFSPGAASGARTPNTLGRKSQPSPANQNMRTIPSPFANSPATWIDTSFLPSPIKGMVLPGSGATPAGGSGYVFEAGSSRGATRDMALTPLRGILGGQGVSFVYDSNIQNEVEFIPADIQRDRSTVDSMRAWRTDAMHQHMYRTAAYWGDKVLSITEDSNDVFWLSQVYYLMGEYSRAINLLRKQKLLESSVACRYLAIQCMIRTERWSEALEYLGDENQFAKGGDSDSSQGVNNADGGIKLEASMCYLRGVVYKNMNNIDRAKECFKEALQIDVKCYDALDSLISNNMLTPSEERKLVDELDFDKQLHGPDAMFVRMLYQSKLKKYDHLDEQEEIYNALSAKFQTENADLMYSKAETYFVQCCFDKCLECTQGILEIDRFNLMCVPMHLVSLYELNRKNELFSIAHELVEQHPKHAVAWFGVGVYYYLVANYMEARRYFSKASTIDPHYGPAWIGFGHSFALEGEHDQAMAAYATSMKLFQGSHLGSMYIGMQHLQQNNVLLAQKYFTSCLAICDTDPLLLNEIAVVHYNLGQYEEAVQSLLKVIEKLQRSQRKNSIWETTWLNLAHTYRKLGQYSDAEKYFLKVDAITSTGPAKASALAGLGFIYQIMGEISSAVECYHKVLAMRPTDQIASEMLKRIMEDKVRVSEMGWMHEYLPDDLKNDDDVNRKVRNLLGGNGEGSSSAAVVPDEEHHGEGPFFAEDIVSDDEYQGEGSSAAVFSGAGYHGEGSSSSAAAIVDTDHHGEGSSSAAGAVVSGGRGKRKVATSSAYSTRAMRTRKDARSDDESMDMEET